MNEEQIITTEETETAETVEVITVEFVEDTYAYYNKMLEYQANILTFQILLVVVVGFVFGGMIGKCLWGK